MTHLTLVPRPPEPEPLRYPTFRVDAVYLDWLLGWLKTDDPLPVLRLGPGVGPERNVA